MSTLKTTNKLNDRQNTRQSTASMRANSSAKPKSALTGIIILAVVCICAVGVIAAIGHGKTAGDDVSSYNLVVTPKDIEEQLKNNPNKTDTGMYDVSMNATWNFKDARSSSSNAVVSNIVTNRNTVYFTVTRSDTGATILKSPYIPVGSQLANIKLEDESLTKGTYPCVVSYYLVDDEYKEISSVSVNIKVVIEN